MKDEDLLAFIALNFLRYFDGNFVQSLRLKSLLPGDLLSTPSLLKSFTSSEKVMAKWYEVLSRGLHLKEFEACKNMGIDLLAFGDESYPSSLCRLSNPPLLLYWWGNQKTPGKAVAVVGTRRCSNYGRRIAGLLGIRLGREGFTTISGGAFGVDEACHEGSIKAEGITIAVFGTGVDQFYPAKNGPLFEKIKGRGALVSEYPLGTKGMPWNFPQRNRIIVGLADVAIIVEAPLKSGAMITGRIAMEHGIETWAVPGRIDEGVAKGSNLLIFDGAYPLVDVDSFVYLMKGSPQGFLASPEEDKLAILSPEEGQIYKILRERGDRTVDNIAGECKMTPASVLECLGKLKLHGLVAMSGPGRWVINEMTEGE